ncbi:putative RING-H2 finger protein ATL69 isoform X1 [Lycium ferocissimum]|uniref:putative RING-H2 finger protein ATL69 isoform X1 n=2 Tax=Lycium ferocissimum TaxID=112874 RepID=UPI002815E424|nr:putative RING-H2 finger protein ATL69 isoform X1 [Lycium ferocissimum]
MEFPKTIALFLFFYNYFIGTIAVPVQRPFVEQVDLSADIRLTRVNSNCGWCESRGGRCVMMDTNFGEEMFFCDYLPAPPRDDKSEFPKGAKYAIAVGAGVPIMLLLIVLLCWITSSRRRAQPVLELSATVAPQPIALVGLDGPTIESYPKTTLGESRRLPKPDDKICPICLAEYQPNETLRTIPECQHSFHTDCIDEWLPLNASCPVCRKSPGPNPLSLSEAP